MRQFFALLWMNLANTRARPGATSVMLLGVIGVLTVMLGLMSISQGLEQTLTRAEKPDRAIVMRTGVTSEIASWFAPESTAVLSTLPGVSATSPELVVTIDLPMAEGITNFVARGITPAAVEIRDEFELLEGRLPESGKAELIVGTHAAQRHPELRPSQSLKLREGTWTVTGVFRQGSGAHDSEIWLDLTAAQSLFRRGGAVSSVRVQLTDPASFSPVKQAIDNEPRIPGDLIGEAEWFDMMAAPQTSLINSFAAFLAFVMGIGALACVFNAAHTAVDTRKRELATLRAFGFSDGAITMAMVAEIVLISLSGAVISAFLIYFSLHDRMTSTLSAESATVAFNFRLTPFAVSVASGCAVFLAVFGALPPLLRATRGSVANALRDAD